MDLHTERFQGRSERATVPGFDINEVHGCPACGTLLDSLIRDGRRVLAGIVRPELPVRGSKTGNSGRTMPVARGELR